MIAQPPPSVDLAPTCWRCRRKLGEYAARPWYFRCPRCKAENLSPETDHAAIQRQMIDRAADSRHT